MHPEGCMGLCQVLLACREWKSLTVQQRRQRFLQQLT
jgi:hypothetical protein